MKNHREYETSVVKNFFLYSVVIYLTIIYRWDVTEPIRSSEIGVAQVIFKGADGWKKIINVILHFTLSIRTL